MSNLTPLDKTLVQFAEARRPGVTEEIARGEVIIEPGRIPEAPVLRDATTKRLVKGSGQVSRANSPESMNRSRAAAEYRGKLYEMIPTDATPEQRLSFERLLDDLYDAANGSPQLVDCPHADCGKKHAYAFKKDAGTLYKIMSNLAGEALRTEESHKTEVRIEALMQLREQPVGLIGLTVEEAHERQQRAIREGVIDATWSEQDAD